MRKSGLILLAVLVSIFFLFMWAFSDRIVERNLEKIGTRIVGAKVEFNGVKLNPFKLRIQWRSLKVTNPDNVFENIVETGRCIFKISPKPLIKKKFIIDSFEITNLRFHTPRKTSGEIKKRKVRKKSGKKASRQKNRTKKKKELLEKAKDKLDKEKESIPIFNPEKYLFVIDTNELLKKFKPKTDKNVKELMNADLSKFEIYSKKVDEIGSDIDNLAEKVQNIKGRISKINKKSSLNQVKNDIDYIKSLLKDVDKLEVRIKVVREDFSKDYVNMENQLSKINSWLKEDYQRIMDNLKLPDISRFSISKFLIGKKVINDFQKVVDIVKKVRSVLFKVKNVMPEKKIPKRMKGQDIIFVQEKELPGFWIKDLFIGGNTKKGIKLSGSIVNLTSNQRLIEKPTVLTIKGKGKYKESIMLSGILNYLKDIPNESFKFEINNFSLGSAFGYDSSQSSDLPIDISGGKGDIDANVDFDGNDFRSYVAVRGKGMIFNINTSGKSLSKAAVNFINEIFSNIDAMDVVMRINYVNENLSLFVDSNIDDIFNRKVEELYSKKKKEAIKNINSYMEKKRGEYKSRYISFITENQNQIKGNLKVYESELEKLKKELESEKRKLNKEYISIKKELEKKAYQEYQKKKSEVETQIQKKKEKAEEKIKSGIKKFF